MFENSSAKEEANNSYSKYSPNKGLKVDDQYLSSDTDSEIENDLPIQHARGFKDHWAVIMKAKDDEEIKKVILYSYFIIFFKGKEKKIKI